MTFSDDVLMAYADDVSVLLPIVSQMPSSAR